MQQLGYIGMQPGMAAFSKVATYFSKSFNLVKQNGLISKLHQWLGPGEGQWTQSRPETSNKD